MSEKRCKHCAHSEISLRRGAQPASGLHEDTHKIYPKLFCSLFGEHFSAHNLNTCLGFMSGERYVKLGGRLIKLREELENV